MLSKQVPYTMAKQVSFDIFAKLLYALSDNFKLKPGHKHTHTHPPPSLSLSLNLLHYPNGLPKWQSVPRYISLYYYCYFYYYYYYYYYYYDSLHFHGLCSQTLSNSRSQSLTLCNTLSIPYSLAHALSRRYEMGDFHCLCLFSIYLGMLEFSTGRYDSFRHLRKVSHKFMG